MFPVGWKYAQSMLKWFQWYLRYAAPSIDEQQKVSSAWKNDTEQCSGADEICDDLLSVQRLSLAGNSTAELMTARLPATVGFARLLHGEGNPYKSQAVKESGKQIASHDQYVYVPSTATTSKYMDVIVRVLCVELGGMEACEVAVRHLHATLSLLSNDGEHLHLDNVCCLEDLGGSAVAWEAVQLYRLMAGTIDQSCQHHMA
mmetsp:Transcript_12770/g.30271  ORF Transcript_12770/g.30271 Transcript_12770/m.30271 type:complete len:202 (+) Transcript_12770:3-608(+)